MTAAAPVTARGAAGAPVATYRLQFRNGVDFDTAAMLAPYLKWLGVSHLYASPIYAAVSGSTHGYDVVDHNLVDPILGGRAGFERMAEALRREGIGILLDIVPNHMAASTENPWWRSVMRLGRESPFAGHFDIDWSRRLTLPILGGSFDEVLSAGDVSLVLEADGIGMRVPGAILPLDPSTHALALEGSGAERLADSIGQTGLTIDEADLLRRSLEDQGRKAELITRLHDAQPWQLTNWKTARENLSYRRFFEVAGLVGVHVEHPDVFADVHRLTLELVRERLVDGLRIDHVDGLSDPAAYLIALRAAVGPEPYLVVEKILGPGEDLPDWDVQGTTGYEFIPALADLLVDRQGYGTLCEAYASWTGRAADPDGELRDAKLQLLTVNFRGELETLGRLAGPASSTDAIAELIAGFDVYRTYAADGMLAGADRQRLDAARMRALSRRPDLAEAIGSAARLLSEGARSDAGAAYRRKFQQLSGPAMAKSLEDTFFYRHHPLIALNEVGSEPCPELGGPEAFHAAMRHRLSTQPFGLTATATHDTKRGEDARARLYALSHEPQAWLDGIARWRGMTTAAGIDPETEWMVYQALAGIWPEGSPHDVNSLTGLLLRFLPFLEKAVREAKLKTDWTEPNAAYELAVRTFAETLLDPSNTAFLSDFDKTLMPYTRIGRLLSNAQLALKLYAPGVPDIYQGTEGEDCSLVDPDNRRPTDFAQLAQAAADAPTVKQSIIRQALALRREHPDLFASGTYDPLEIPHPWRESVTGFSRRHAGRSLTLVILHRPLAFLRLLEAIDGTDTKRPTLLSTAQLADLAENGYVVIADGTGIA